MSIMTNCGMLYLSPQVILITESLSNELKLVIFVFLEHFLLAMVWGIHKAIPDRPRWVRIALAKGEYVSGQALKREVRHKPTTKMFDKLSF